MNFEVKFKSIDYSESLVEYVKERFEKLSKYEIRPITVHVTFSETRHEHHAEVFIKGIHGTFGASDYSDETHYMAIDSCLRKLKRQMEKEKSKIKEHHHYEHTEEAMLDEMAYFEELRRRGA